MISTFPDRLDPQLAQSAEGWAAVYNAYLPLLTYRHAPGAAGTEVVPGLAEALPRVSPRGTAYELRVREGLEYSDGRPVQASDFERAIERLFELNSPGSHFYGEIAGAAAFQRGDAAEISGIETDDSSRTIEIRLKRPRGTFTNELALSYATPVPRGTPMRDQTETPIPSAAPYEIAGVEPGREYRLRRNPAWERNGARIPELPDGELDEIEVRVEKNPSNQTTLVAQNRADAMLDPPPSDRLREVESRYGERFRLDPAGGTFFFWMNTQRAPFDDPRVRRAVNFALDREAMAKIHGGLMTPTQQVLPPELPGYEPIEPYPHDPGKASRLLAAARPEDRQVVVWTIGQEPNDRAGQYLHDVLVELGFDAELKTLGPAIFFETIGDTSTPELDIGWSNWFSSYPHPNDFFESLLDGESISPTHNNNNSMFDRRAINREIGALSRVSLSEEVGRRYAALDRRVMRAAPLAPYGNLERTTFVSGRINFERVYFHPVFTHDFTSFALEE